MLTPLAGSTLAGAARAAVRDALATESDLPSATVAAHVIIRLEPRLLEELGNGLLMEYFLELIRSERE